MNAAKDFYYVTDDKHQIKSADVERLLKRTYWASQRTKEVIQKSIDNSICYGVFDSESNLLIGFARVVTDYATIFYLADVIVDEAYQGKGIGKFLVDTVVNDDKIKGLRGILLTKDAHKLYERFGFNHEMERCMVK
ncbi:MAG: GNAT family N-acetyltransferase [Lachnospiraceae bacterium]|nr:GNAT family N-acetyltransferase [Lachnospiraceae bacterium]